METKPKSTRKKPVPTTNREPGEHPHDAFARKEMKKPEIAGDFLRHYADPVIRKHVDLDNLKEGPTQNFGTEFQELIKDITFVSHLIDKKGKAEVLIIAEHKSRPEPFVILQLLVYLAVTWYKRWTDSGRPQSIKKFRLPLPILVVLYNGKKDWQGELDLKNLLSSVPAELEPFIPQIKVLFIQLNQFDIKNLPGKPETRAVVESMIRATNGTFVAGLESILGHFTGLTLDDRINDLAAEIIYYCDRVEAVTPDEIDKAILNTIKGPEGIKMAQTIKKGISQIAWEGGVAKGEVKGGARIILRFLNRRFQKVPKSVKDKVCSIMDIDRLDELTDQAAECQSIDEFAESLNR
jgi:hypothetical protein